MASCPICEKPVKPRHENTAFPFCSARCKTIDLGKWLSEEYRVSREGEGEGEGAGDADDAAESDAPPKAPVRH